MITSEATSLGDSFATTQYPRPFRRCQELALAAFEKARSHDRKRLHFVLPPGTGKTVLGLEIARRLGQRTLILCPNTAIQAQWAHQWAEFRPHLLNCGTESEELSLLTALTYQAVCVLEDDEDLIERSLSLWRASLEVENGLTSAEAVEEISQLREARSPHYGRELARYKQHTRLASARTGSREEFLGLLHPNGRDLLERMKASGPWTLLLDECHHLLEMWGYLVRAFVDELGDQTIVVGLTATPPQDLDLAQQKLYSELFSRTDFELPTPAAVKDGSLAPYQDLVYLTTPVPHELEYIEEQHSRFLRLISRLMDHDFGSLSFVQWAQERTRSSASSRKVVRDWSRFERDRPALSLALLRFLYHYKLELPEGVLVQERHRQQLNADDWVTLLEDYCLRQLKPSFEEKDHAAWQEIRAALPSVGYVLTTRGIRSYVSPVDRVLSLSASKGAATLAVLAAEERALEKGMRALVLCDYEQAGSDLLAKLRGVLDPQAGSAALLMRTLLADPQTARLNPVLLTGKTVACSRSTAMDLECWLSEQYPRLKGQFEIGQLTVDAGEDSGWEQLVVVRGASSWWSPRNYVPPVTRFFEEGRSRCLVGTRGLLGEGWDARKVNVVIDLTAATTSTAVHQSRGRSLRLDPALPEKVADNWDVVCVSPHHPRGFADYARFVRKHHHYYGLTADGEIESGISHVHAALSPYGAPPAEQFRAINERQLERPRERAGAEEKWAVGQPYLNRETQTLRAKIETPSRVPTSVPVRTAGSKQSIDISGMGWIVVWQWVLLILGGFMAGLALLNAGDWGDGPSVLFLVGLATLVLARLPALLLVPMMAFSPLVRSDPTKGVQSMAEAVIDALNIVGETNGGRNDLRVIPQGDGHYRCYLETASPTESRIFADALDELISPISNPRCILPRYMLTADGLWSRLSMAARVRRRPSRSGAAIVWHAVPGVFSASKERIAAFENAWNRHVSPGKVLYSHGLLAQEIIRFQRGENPLEVSTQKRMLWT